MDLVSSKDLRASRSAIRARVDALSTVTVSRAKAVRATPVTLPYTVRQIRECVALLAVVDDFAACPDVMLLVKVENGIEVWRKPLSEEK